MFHKEIGVFTKVWLLILFIYLILIILVFHVYDKVLISTNQQKNIQERN